MPSEEVEIEIGLRSTWWNTPPMCKVFLNDTIILQNTSIKEPMVVKWSGNLLEADHRIRILRHGKNFNSEVVLDENKNIIKDQILEVEYVKIDGVDLGYMLYKCSKFRDSEGIEFENLMDMGTNGTWELNFKVPTYIWLLENI